MECRQAVEILRTRIPCAKWGKSKFHVMEFEVAEQIASMIELMEVDAVKTGEVISMCKECEVNRAMNDALQSQLQAKDAELREEQEEHAKLQARCYEGFPSVSDGIFDALQAKDAEAAILRDYLQSISSNKYANLYLIAARALQNTTARAGLLAEKRAAKEQIKAMRNCVNCKFLNDGCPGCPDRSDPVNWQWDGGRKGE